MARGTTATAETVQQDAAGLVTVGIDVSDRYSQLCVLGDQGAVLCEGRIGTTTAALTQAMSTLRGWCSR